MVSIKSLSTAVLAIASVAPWSATAAPDPLALHNQLRAAHSAPPLKWNANLAAEAQSHSDRCVFETMKNPPYGQNVGIKNGDWAATIDWTAIITGWYNNNKFYDYSKPSSSSETAQFTQIVWIGTTEIGCAVSGCNGAPVYTCNYYPRGNFGNAANYIANVKPN